MHHSGVDVMLGCWCIGARVFQENKISSVWECQKTPTVYGYKESCDKKSALEFQKWRYATRLNFIKGAK